MEELTLSTWQYDIVTCFLVFLGRFLGNNLSDIHGFIHACLSVLAFCLCSRFFWSFSSNDSSFRLARAAFATDNNRLVRAVAKGLSPLLPLLLSPSRVSAHVPIIIGF